MRVKGKVKVMLDLATKRKNNKEYIKKIKIKKEPEKKTSKMFAICILNRKSHFEQSKEQRRDMNHDERQKKIVFFFKHFC